MSIETFSFDEAPDTAIFACRHVMDGAPILFVAHDQEGDWQFLCGEGSHQPKDGLLVGLGCMVERDPSINELSKMCTGHHATRASQQAPWSVVDEHEAFIAACVIDPGWSVQMLPAGETDDEPAFAYTIGIFANYKQAELIVVGLRLELMHAMLNTLARRIKNGETLVIGDRIEGVIEGFDVMLREVTAPGSFEEHVGYARWFYKYEEFPLFQVLWPDKKGRFPDEPGATDAFRRQQPVLP
jgi:Domain of unknown function (DUF4262)